MRHYRKILGSNKPSSQRFWVCDSWSVLERTPLLLPKKKINLKIIHVFTQIQSDMDMAALIEQKADIHDCRTQRIQFELLKRLEIRD